MTDCNENLIPDECDLSEGVSRDCNSNGLLDECEDCNGNGVPDDCDLECTSEECAACFGEDFRGEFGHEAIAGCTGVYEGTFESTSKGTIMGTFSATLTPQGVFAHSLVSNDAQIPPVDGIGSVQNDGSIFGTAPGAVIFGQMNLDECTATGDWTVIGVGFGSWSASRVALICSADCNENAIPDECDVFAGEPDSDGDVVPDECDGCPFETFLTEPQAEYETSCLDAIDNDCDGDTDESDSDCGK